jgi:hypothetical protein
MFANVKGEVSMRLGLFAVTLVLTGIGVEAQQPATAGG